MGNQGEQTPEQRPPSLAAHLWRFATRGSLRNTAWLGSASAVNGVLGAVTSALLARALGLGSFGTYTLMISVTNLLTDFGDLGMTSTFVRFGSASIAEGDTTRFRRVFTIFARSKLFLGSAVVLLAVLLLDPFLEFFFGHVDAGISGYLPLIIAAVAFGIASSVLIPVYQASGRFRTQAMLAVSRYGARLVMIAAALVLWQKFSIPTALAVEIIALAVLISLGAGFLPVRPLLIRGSGRDLRTQMLSFSSWLSLYQVLTLVSGRLDIFFVGGMLDAEALGVYGAAARISALVITGTNAYYTVLITEMSAASDGDDLRRRFRDAMKTVALFSLGIVVLALLAGPVIGVIFGSAFRGAVSLLQIMCIGLVFAVAAYPVNAMLFARNRTAVFPVMAVASAAVTVGINLWLVPRWGAPAAALAFSANWTAAFLVSTLFGFAGVRRGARNPR